MALTGSELVGFLVAQFKKAARLRVWQFAAQIAIAVPAAASVLVTNDVISYVLAVVGAVLLVAWWVINILYLAARDAAHTSRRAAFLVGGLPHVLSAAETLSLQDRMKVSKEVALANSNPNYYASTLPPGPGRLSEMIEESAFYSAPLQRVSARVMLAVILLFVVIAASLVLLMPFFQEVTSLLIIRLILAGFVFAMSSDVVGAYLAHKDAAKRIEEVRVKLMSMSADPSELSVLLAMTDYNSAVESAPESVPFAYRLKEKELNAKWAEYQKNRKAVRAAAPSESP